MAQENKALQTPGSAPVADGEEDEEIGSEEQN